LQNKDTDDISTKQELSTDQSRVRIKREPTEDSAAQGQGKKRKIEVIVLDD
jgi:hypothetical protein